MPHIPPRWGPWTRVALVAGGFTLIAIPTALLASQLPGMHEDHPGAGVRALVGVAVVVPLVLLACRLLERRSPAVLGLGSPGRGWLTLTASALAVAGAVVLVMGTAALTGSATVDTARLGSAALTAVAMTPLLVAASAVPEELVFRGYVQHVLGQRLAPMSMIAAQAALFAAFVAAVTQSADAVPTSFVTGVGLGYLRLFSGGLWAVLGTRIVLTAATLFLPAAGLVFTRGTAFWDLLLGVGAFVAAFGAATVLRARGSARLDADGRTARRELPEKGILYDVGTSYMPGQHSRARWRPDVVREELRVIHEDLHCTAVTLFGGPPQRLEEAGRMALEQGLYVWLQPRHFDAPIPPVLDNLAEVAELAERLRTAHPNRVGLSVGCEISLLHRGVLPGGMHSRMRWLIVVSAIAPPYLGWRVNRVLRRMVAVARRRFDGPVSYGAGTWESIDWTPFDVVGVNYYTDEMTQSDYRGGLRRLSAHGKPVIVTEFGCCSYDGAQDKGGSGADIMDWSDLDDRRITGDHVRDEQIQADHIEAQLDVFETEQVHGAHLCMFIEGDCHYSTDPARDLDMASFGIVRPPTPESGLSADDGHWEPKLAFHALARRYGAHIPAESS